MRKSVFSLVAAAGLVALSAAVIDAPLTAQAARPGAIDLSAVESGTYSADAGHSLAAWRVSHFGFNDYFGIFGDIEGTLVVDAANPANSRVDVTIPIASVTVPSAGLREHLLRAGRDGGAADFFGPDPAPARFVSTSVELTGETTANVTGNLTLNGVTRPITIAAELSGMGNNPMNRRKTLGFHGTTTIRRSEFNIPWGIPFGIADEVGFTISVAFEK